MLKKLKHCGGDERAGLFARINFEFATNRRKV